MEKFKWIAVGVLVGFSVAFVGGGLTLALAQNSQSQSEAAASLARQNDVLNKIAAQWAKTDAEMTSTMQMTMTPAEKAMMKEMEEMHQEIKMLMQMDQEMMKMENGSKNK